MGNLQLVLALPQEKSGFQPRRPTLERGRSRGTKAPVPGERPRKGRRARIKGVSGPAARREGRDRTRKANRPRLFPTPCALFGLFLRLFLDQGQSKPPSAGNGDRFFQGMHPKSPKVQNGGGRPLENRPSDRGFFSCATMRKIGELFLTGAKEAEGGATS